MDTAMICLPLSLCPDWKASSAYAEDYYFIRSVMKQYRDRHVYLNHVAAYYNALQPRAVARLRLATATCNLYNRGERVHRDSH